MRWRADETGAASVSRRRLISQFLRRSAAGAVTTDGVTQQRAAACAQDGPDGPVTRARDSVTGEPAAYCTDDRTCTAT
jgi:hypothetical protein